MSMNLEFVRGDSDGIDGKQLKDGQVLFDIERQRISLDAVVDSTLTRVNMSSSGGHTIVDEDDTTLTQRGKLKFDEGFDVTDDSTDGQTVISPTALEEGDMEDIVYPLPSDTPSPIPSGGGGGHTIEDATGTELEQRDTLQFGEGFIAEDDDTNEKTVVLPNVMQSGDMSDIIHGLPAVTDKAYLKYSTDEQVIGEWVDHKPLYQKTFIDTMPTRPTSGSFNYKYIDIGASVDYAEIVSACVLDSAVFMPFLYLTNDLSKYTKATINNNNHSTSPNKLGINCNNWYGLPCYITIRYTKTTDTPNT